MMCRRSCLQSSFVYGLGNLLLELYVQCRCSLWLFENPQHGDALIVDVVECVKCDHRRFWCPSVGEKSMDTTISCTLGACEACASHVELFVCEDMILRKCVERSVLGVPFAVFCWNCRNDACAAGTGFCCLCSGIGVHVLHSTGLWYQFDGVNDLWSCGVKGGIHLLKLVVGNYPLGIFITLADRLTVVIS